MMCPHCGLLVDTGPNTLVADHGDPLCPGSGQNPRCAQSDARPLWNGTRNPHFAGAPVGDNNVPREHT